jgi:uncharacterized protein YgiM (DUF1202 family)
MKHLRWLLILCSLLIVGPLPAGAQGGADEVCPVLVANALTIAGENCTGLPRNTACYGHDQVTAAFWPGSDAPSFAIPADQAPLDALQQITTGPLDLDSEQWGVALINLQADLPDTLPGQAVTMILMGDVTVENQVMPDAAAAEPVAATASTNANLRAAPSTSAAIRGGVSAGDTLTITGRNEAGDWFAIQTADQQTAWLWGDLLTADDPAALTALPVVADAAASAYRQPMQAFYFTTGFGGTTCQEAPNALTLQNTSGTTVALNVNGLDVTLASTLILTTTPHPTTGDPLLVGVLVEGTATVIYAAFTAELTAPGEAFAVTLNADGLIDEDSELLTLTDTGDLASVVQNTCSMLITYDLAAGPLTADDCTAPLSFATEPPPNDPPAMSDIGVGDPCTIAAINTVNLRRGPGTHYEWSLQLAPGERRQVSGYATGIDGYRWWALPDGRWVRGDLVNQAGACDSVSIAITPVAPTAAPTSAPPPGGGGGGGRAGIFEIGGIGTMCQMMNDIRAGQSVTFQTGTGRWPTIEEYEAARAGMSAAISIDGAGLGVYYEGPTWHTGGPTADGYGDRARADWIASSGTHTVTGQWFGHPGGSSTHVCTFTVP